MLLGGPVGWAVGGARLLAKAVEDDFLGIGTALEESGILPAVESAFDTLKGTIQGVINDVFGGGGPQLVEVAPGEVGFTQDAESFYKLGEAAGSGAGGFGSGFLDAITGAMSSVADFLSPITDEIMNVINEDIGPGLRDLGEGIGGFFSNLEGTKVGNIVELASGLAYFIREVLVKGIDILGDIAGGLLSGIGDALPEIGTAINDFVSAIDDLLGGDLKGFLIGVGDGLRNIVGAFLQFTTGIANGVIEAIEAITGLDFPSVEEGIAAWEGIMSSIGFIIEFGVAELARAVHRILDSIKIAILTILREVLSSVPGNPFGGAVRDIDEKLAQLEARVDPAYQAGLSIANGFLSGTKDADVDANVSSLLDRMDAAFDEAGGLEGAGLRAMAGFWEAIADSDLAPETKNALLTHMTDTINPLLRDAIAQGEGNQFLANLLEMGWSQEQIQYVIDNWDLQLELDPSLGGAINVEDIKRIKNDAQLLLDNEGPLRMPVWSEGKAMPGDEFDAKTTTNLEMVVGEVDPTELEHAMAEVNTVLEAEVKPFIDDDTLEPVFNEAWALGWDSMTPVDLEYDIETGKLEEGITNALDEMMLNAENWYSEEDWAEFGGPLMAGLISGAEQHLDEMYPEFEEQIDAIIANYKAAAGIESPATKFFPVGEEIMAGIVQGATLSEDKTSNTFVGTFTRLLTTLETEAAKFSRIGEAIIDGISAGIDTKTAELLDTVRATAQAAADAMKDELDISSPSGVFKAMGVNISEGLARGILDSQRTVNEAMLTLMGQTMGPGGGNVYHYTTTTQGPSFSQESHFAGWGDPDQINRGFDFMQMVSGRRA